MHKKAMLLSTVLLLGLTANAFTAEAPAGETAADETQAVEQATNQFYASLNALLAGDPSSMEQCWSHADDVTYMGPVGGIQTGWDQVRTMWDVRSEMKSGGHVEPMDLRITVGNDLAIVEGYQISSNSGIQGEPRASRLRATSSFRKENGEWKLIGHHTDLLDSLNSDSDKTANDFSTPTPQKSFGNPVGDTSDADAGDDPSIDVSNEEVILKLEN